MLRHASVCLLFLGALGSAAAPAVGQGARLLPSAIPALPPAVRKELERRQCSIPQVPSDTTLRNVIQGHLRRAGQLDWAVLCAVPGYSSVLVFWSGGSPQHPSEVAVATGDEVLRTIDVIDSARIPQPQPVGIAHDALRVVLPESGAAATYYWDEPAKKWVA